MAQRMEDLSCYGGTCKSDSELVALDESKTASWRYQAHQAERDASAGYPTSLNIDEDTHKFIQNHIEQRSGRLLSAWEVEAIVAAEEEKRLNEASQKPAFKVKPGLIEDWPGDRFT